MPTHQVDRLLSEDIDGPSDFTQNMEAYFRGGSLRRGSLRLGLKPKDDGAAGDEMIDDEHANDNANGTMGATNDDLAQESTPAAKLNESASKQDSEVNSEWDPYVETQTPVSKRSETQQAFLQPTVEEYYSEIAPANLPSIHKPRAMSTHSHEAVRNHAESIQASVARPTASIGADEQLAKAAGSQSSASGSEDLEKQLHTLNLKCQDLEKTNASFAKALENERHLREETTAAYEAVLAEVSQRDEVLADMKAQSQQLREDFRRDSSDISERLRKYETQHKQHQSELESVKHAHTIEIQESRSQLDRERRESQRELRALAQDVELARRSRDDAEETARLELEKVDEQHAQLDQLKMEIQRGEELRESIKEQLRNARMDNERLEGAKKTVEKVEADMKTALEQKDEQTKELKEQHAGALAGLQSHVKELSAQLAAEEQRASTQDTANAEVGGLRTELNNLRTSFNDTLLERDALQDDLTNAKEQLVTVQTALETERSDKKIIDAQLASKISEGIRNREKHWREKLRILEDEKKVMARTLLRAWGREDMAAKGIDGKLDPSKGMTDSGWQGYRYMFTPAERKGKRRVTFAEP